MNYAQQLYLIYLNNQTHFQHFARTINPAHVPNIGKSNCCNFSLNPYKSIKRRNVVDSPPGNIRPSISSSCSTLL